MTLQESSTKSMAIQEHSGLGTIDFSIKSEKPFKSVHVKISTDRDISELKTIPYTANRILVSNDTTEKIQCFISAFTGGSDKWYDIVPGFDKQSWERNGWEVVVFRNEGDTKRVGFYINNIQKTTQIRFRSFTDVEIVQSK